MLTSLGPIGGPTPVVVTNGALSSQPFFAMADGTAPSLVLLSARGDVVATHGDGSLAGPGELCSGCMTPVKPGEAITLWATGLGLPTEALTEGSAKQAGTLTRVVCLIGDMSARPDVTLVSPGLYRLDLTMPARATAGAHTIVCTYPGTFSPIGNLLVVGR